MVDFYFEKGSDGLTILGMMGEAPTLTHGEALEVTRRVIARSSGRNVVVGVSSPGLPQWLNWQRRRWTSALPASWWLRKLAEEGATVFAAARDQQAIAAWIAEIDPAVQGRLTPVVLDLARLDSVDGLAERLKAHGGVDILVNNSGGPPPMTAQDAKRWDWLTQFEIMAASLFHLSQQLLPQMIGRKWGRILTVASSGVEQPLPRPPSSVGRRRSRRRWRGTA